jgi:hypothetical protein
MRNKNNLYCFLIAFLILLQRTEIQKSHSLVYKKFNRVTKNKFNVINILFQSVWYNKIFYAYEISTVDESDLLYKLLLDEFSHSDLIILDVGVGIGGYHKKWISEHKNNSTLYLMDNSEFNIRALSYGHGSSDRYYNSLFLTKKFLNNVDKPKVKIESIEIKKDYPGSIPMNLDLIVSFISWGFHYSLEEYWDTITQRMSLNYSILVIDVRKNSHSSNFLKKQKKFTVEVLSNNSKSNRVLIRKIGV